MTHDSDLFHHFVRLEWLLHRYHQQNHRHHGPMGDPHRGQGRVLALLKLKPKISQKELSDILDIRSQSLGELLAKLERSGYITRTPSPTDRRVVDVSLTDSGREASGQTEQQLDTEALFGCLSEEEKTALSDYLSRIISALAQQLGNEEPGSDNHHHPHFGGRGFGHYYGHHSNREGGHPPLGPRGFGRCSDMECSRPPFDGRGFDRRLALECDRPSYDDRGFGRRPGMECDRPSYDDRDFDHPPEVSDESDHSSEE